VPQILRPLWDGFPDVVIVADVRPVKRHAQYEQAKAGNVQDAAPAAKRLAAEFVSNESIERIKQLSINGALLVPVHALEGGGFNRIPGAFAELLAEKLDLEVETGIVQANIVNHTGASGWARIARPPKFSGDVLAGRKYVLVDDFIGQGGTLANLRGHIICGGGHVVGAITLTGKEYSAKLALRPATLNELRRKHGQETENWWRENFGHGFDGLTESEARYLVRAEDADTIRAKLAEAGFAGDD
jgi:predicted amidophosphoribosyltransferase